jgi:hypothetical protein
MLLLTCVWHVCEQSALEARAKAEEASKAKAAALMAAQEATAKAAASEKVWRVLASAEVAARLSWRLQLMALSGLVG